MRIDFPIQTSGKISSCEHSIRKWDFVSSIEDRFIVDSSNMLVGIEFQIHKTGKSSSDEHSSNK